MLCVYVDGIVAVSSKARDAIQQITEVFAAKEGGVGVPERYLGTDIEKIQAADGRMEKVKNPFTSGYKPELDVMDEVGNHLFSRYAQLIGILRWAIELGQIDIALEMVFMVQYQPNPRTGHLEVLYHMFAYLKSHSDLG
eukprot:6299882-Ditylum_brightwellii.AAC.1